MGLLRSVGVTAACFALLLACGKSTDTVDGSGNARDPRYSYSPLDAVRTCASDADCVIVPSIANCGTCCGQGSVTRGEGDKGCTAALNACGQPGAPASLTCLAACWPSHPACFEGTCVKIDDPLAGVPAPSATCSQDAGAKIAGGAPGDLGPGPACGATAVKTGFEDALDPSWAVTTPSAFQIDRSAPINGGASLRISYRQQDAFFAIPQPEACGVRIAFTLRTKLLSDGANGLNLARIVAGDGSWLHLSLGGCELAWWAEFDDGVAHGGGGPTNATWPVPDETAVRVVVTVDVRGKSVTTTAAPIGQPLPAPRATPLLGNPTGIRSIEIGSTNGMGSDAVGTVWLDDLTID